MPDTPLTDRSPPREQGAFLTTRWSLVLNAGAGQCQRALAELCRDYWYPLYAFLRRRGHPMHDAQDLTQTFFLHLIEGGMLTRAQAERGKFRTYLLGAMTNFLANEHRRQSAQKRGGGETIFSIEALRAEERFALEPAHQMTPESQYEQSWAFALLERAITRLSTDYERAGRGALFEKLKPYLASKSSPASHEDIARELQMSTSAVGVAIHRMRRRYGELLREEVAETVSSPEEVRDEILHLLQVVSR